MKVISFGCGPWRWYRGVGEIYIYMNKGRVGEERGGKEMDGGPLTGDVVDVGIWSLGRSRLVDAGRQWSRWVS
jgi:hypothetical protein